MAIRAKQIEAAMAGAGIARAASTGILSVSTGAGVTISGDDVLIDVASTVAFSGASWSFGVDELTVGTPTSGTAVANKSYVDSVAAGLQWVEPCDVGPDGYVGNLGEVALEALSPSAGDTYVVTATDGDSTLDGSAITVGDVVEHNGSIFIVILAGVGGFVPDGTRLAVAVTTALVSPLSEATDDGKIAEFDGTSNTPTLVTPVDGDAFLVNGESTLNENKGYTYDGTVPTGSWIQFTGTGATVAFDTIASDSGGSIVADSSADTATFSGGDGITTVGTPGSDTITWSAVIETAGAGEGGLAFDAGELRVLANTSAGIELTASGVAVDLEAAGAGTGGLAFDSGEIRVDAGLGLELLAGGVTVDLEAAGSGTGGLAFDGNEIRVTAGDGIELTAGGVAADLAAAGAGTGGLAIVGTEIAVDAGDGIELTAGGVAVDAANDSIGVAGAGIEAAVPVTGDKGTAASVTSGSGTDTGVDIAAAPANDSYPMVDVNGILYRIGSGVKTEDFYLSADGGTTAKAFAAVAASDSLYVGDNLLFDLDGSDLVSFHYVTV